mgnify:CR=1 FL=1
MREITQSIFLRYFLMENHLIFRSLKFFIAVAMSPRLMEHVASLREFGLVTDTRGFGMMAAADLAQAPAYVAAAAQGSAPDQFVSAAQLHQSQPVQIAQPLLFQARAKPRAQQHLVERLGQPAQR